MRSTLHRAHQDIKRGDSHWRASRITASDEIELADWLFSSLFSFRQFVAGCVVPPVYEAYARILHPARSASGNVSWADIAKWGGRVYHASMQFEAIATPHQNGGLSPKPWGGQVPGYMPTHQVESLANVLGVFTSTPDTMRYLVWEGYGHIPRTSRPRVGSPERKYLLYCGGIEDMRGRSASKGDHEPPEYWFPEDKAWCVATDMDLFWTYVGGSRACIDTLLRSPDLEAVPATIHDGLDVESDAINRL